MARSTGDISTREGSGKGAVETTEPSTKTQAKEAARGKVEEVKEETKAKARELGNEAEDRADRLTSSMGRRADSLARALGAAAETLRQEGEASMADMAGEAAEQVERVGGYLDDEDPSAMLEDFESLGQRNPGAFLGSAFAMGLAAGRFLRASRPDARRTGMGNGDGTPQTTRTTRASAESTATAARPVGGSPATSRRAADEEHRAEASERGTP